MSDDERSDLESLYDTGVEPEPTPVGERLRRAVDLYVLAPGRVALTDWRAVVGTAIIVVFLFMDTIGTRLVERPSSGDAPNLVQPFADPSYLLGTDPVGRPIGAQLVHATPDMLRMVFTGAVAAVGFAALVGPVSGLFRGSTVDSVLMTITDIVITIPGLPLIIVLVTVLQPRDPYLIGVLLGLDNWPGLARTVRSQILSIREESYVEVSQLMDLRTHTILRRDMLGPLMPYVMVNAALAARRIIFESVGLYFLGILPFNTLNWGVMMNLAYENGALSRPDMLHYLVFPMVTIFVMSFGLVLFSQGMDSVFDVRLRARHASTVDDDGRPTCDLPRHRFVEEFVGRPGLDRRGSSNGERRWYLGAPSEHAVSGLHRDGGTAGGRRRRHRNRRDGGRPRPLGVSLFAFTLVGYGAYQVWYGSGF